MSLASVLFTDYRRRVLGLLLLHPEQHYHLRELARMTGTVPGTLTRELAKLTEAGVLQKMSVGNQVHYQANADCPIFSELAAVLRKTSGLADVLAEGLLPLAGQIECAFVFGSMASGKAGSGSDIDLMVIADVSFKSLVSTLHPLQAILGREINPKLYPRHEWQAMLKAKGAFARDVLAKPKLFVIGNERDLQAEGSDYMTLQNLLDKTLEQVQPDAATIARLLGAARTSLADARLASLSNEGRFDLAYKSIMQTANAALQANGFRTLTSKPGHQQTMIQTLPLTLALDATTMVQLDALRKQRNAIDYSGDLVSAAMATEAIAHAESLLQCAEAWLHSKRPDLLA